MYDVCEQVTVVLCGSVFFFNDTATTEIYTLSLHDALPISGLRPGPAQPSGDPHVPMVPYGRSRSLRASRHGRRAGRSEEHTSELQSRQYLVCRLLLEKKKENNSHSRWTATGTECAHLEAGH